MSGLISESCDTSIEYSQHYAIQYGVSNGYFFYIEKSLENDCLVFSLDSFSDTILSKVNELVGVLESNSLDRIHLENTYLEKSDEEQLEFIGGITRIFASFHIIQCSQFSSSTQDIGLYDTGKELAIISKVEYEMKDTNTRMRARITPKQYWTCFIASIVPWQIIGLATHNLLLGNFDSLQPNQFNYSIGAYIGIIIWFGVSIALGIGLSLDYKKRIVSGISLGMVYTAFSILSVHIMNSISIHRVLNIPISVESLLFRSGKLFNDVGLWTYYASFYYALLIPVFLFTIIGIVLLISYIRFKKQS